IISVLTTFIFLMLSFSTYFTEVRIEYKIGFFLATAILLLKFFSMYSEIFFKSNQDFKNASKVISIRSISNSIFTLILVLIIGLNGLYLGMIISLILVIIYSKKIFPVRLKYENCVNFKDLVKIGFPILIVGM